MVGSLMYAILSTRPDIAFSVSVISRYTTNYELCFQGTLLTNLSSFEVLGSMLQTIIAIIL
jgi:putative flippase GtrA